MGVGVTKMGSLVFVRNSFSWEDEKVLRWMMVTQLQNNVNIFNDRTVPQKNGYDV